METGENNPILQIVDKSFNNDFLNQYHLSIELSKKTLSYCIIDTKKLKCHLLHSVNYNNQEDLSNLLSNDMYITKKFHSKSIALSNYPNTLVPEELYNEKDNKKIFELNHEKAEVILIDNLNNYQIKNIFSIPETLNQTINNLIPNINIKSQTTILIDYILSKNYNAEKLTLYIKDNYVNILIANNNQLIFQNKFQFSTKEDLLFYSLFCIQEMNLSPEKIDTEIYGNISKSGFQILYEYIRNIQYGNKLKDISFSNEFHNIEEHCFNILYRQHLCE
jgi:hypothetical protein